MDDIHEEVASKAFRPGRRPLWIAVAANAVLFVGLVLFPYLRGQARAGDARERFAVLAACFYGGTAAPSPGLELPAGERERYAANVLLGDAAWPESCREPLLRVAPDEPFLLFPGAKQAEQQVRDAVALVDAELASLSEERREGVGVVPARPRLAVGRLLAALAALHQVTGASFEGNAIAFDEDARLPQPARVPLSVAYDAVMRMSAEADGVTAVALDRHGIARVHVSAGRVDAQRLGRPRLVRATVPGPEAPWVVWAMASERCAGDEHRCAYHALGLASLGDEVAQSLTPIWYAGHPTGRVDRVLHVGEESAWLVAAREGEPWAEVRRFPIAATRAEGVDRSGEPPPVVAAEATPLEGMGEGDTALVLPGEPPSVVWSARDEALVRFRVFAVGGEVAELAAVPGGAPFAFACEAAGVRWLALGTAGELRVARDLAVSGPIESGVLDPVAAEDPERDALDLACDAERLDVLLRRAGGTLVAVSCDAAARCGAPYELAAGVGHADAVREEGVTLVAWAAAGASAAVRVARLSPEREDGAIIPAACWRDDEMEPGFCGAPRFAARNGRILLATRERGDMLVVESTDAGRTWRPMRGIR